MMGVLFLTLVEGYKRGSLAKKCHHLIPMDDDAKLDLFYWLFGFFLALAALALVACITLVGMLVQCCWNRIQKKNVPCLHVLLPKVQPSPA